MSAHRAIDELARLAAERHCYRCGDCLGVIFVDGARLDTIECATCSGRFEYLGRVGRDARLKRDTLDSACDSRCTNARGPHCECPCGGANHGTGALRVVTVDAGAIPRVATREGAEARAAEWRTADAEAREILGSLPRRGPGWLSRAAFEAALEADRLRDRLRDARGMRSQAGRMRAIGEVLQAAREMERLAPPSAPPDDPKVPVPLPLGERVQIEGTILGAKYQDTEFGEVARVTLRVDADGGHWIAWGTLPAIILDEATRRSGAQGGFEWLRGKRLALEAKLRAGREPHFAAFTRPTRAQLLETKGESR